MCKNSAKASPKPVLKKEEGWAWDQQPHPHKNPNCYSNDEKKPFRYTTAEKRRHILGCIHDGAR